MNSPNPHPSPRGTLGILEKVVGPATTVRAAAKKVALGHFFLFPSYTALFYGWLSVFEERGSRVACRSSRIPGGTSSWRVGVLARGEHGEPHVLSADVPRLCLNVAGLYWNAFLSYQNVRATAIVTIAG